MQEEVASHPTYECSRSVVEYRILVSLFLLQLEFHSFLDVLLPPAFDAPYNCQPPLYEIVATQYRPVH